MRARGKPRCASVERVQNASDRGRSFVRADNRDVLYGLFSPTFERIARRVPASVSPNHLTCLGLLCVGTGATLLMTWTAPTACFVTAGLIALYEIFDGIDGKHARNTGQVSPFGAFLDDAVDAIATGLLYTAFVVRFELYSSPFILGAVFRLVYQCLNYASVVETRVRINPEYGTTGENVTLFTIMVLSGLFPGSIDLLRFAGEGSWLGHALVSQKLATLNFVQGTLLFALCFMPVLCVQAIVEARRDLSKPRPAE